MKYYYSVVRYVPDSFRGEFVNVGVIVVSADESEWKVRRVGNSARARRMGSDTSITAVLNYLDQIETIVSTLTDDDNEAPSAAPILNREWLTGEHRRLRNLVQLTEPMVMVAEDVDEAASKAFDIFVVDPDRQQRNTRSRAISLLRGAYIQTMGAQLGRQLVHEKVVGHVGRQRLEIDFAVGNGSLAHLSHAWSFRAQNTRSTVEKIKAWSWTLRELRDSGGTIHVPDSGLTYTLSTGIPVEVVYDEPRTDSGRRDLDESLEVFDQLNVTALPTTEVRRVAIDAIHLLTQQQTSSTGLHFPPRSVLIPKDSPGDEHTITGPEQGEPGQGN